MRSICLLFLVLFVNIGYSQSKKVWILDSLTHKPVVNAVLHTAKGDFYSNNNGVISLNRDFNETIQLYRLGYVKKALKLTAPIDTIFLAQKVIMLNPVKVENKKKIHFFKIGYYNRRSSFIFYDFMNLNYRYIVAVYIPCSDRGIYINKILLKIKSTKDIKNYNVYLYQTDSSGKPGKVLFKKYIIVGSLKKRGVINISASNIKMPQSGIYVGLENLKENNYSKSLKSLKTGIVIKCTDKIDSGKTYLLIKNSNLNQNNIWRRFGTASNTYNTPSFTPRFGLEVYYK